MLLGITERLEVVDAPGHVDDLKRYRARGYTIKNNRIAIVTDRPMEVVEVHPPSANSVNHARRHGGALPAAAGDGITKTANGKIDFADVVWLFNHL